MGKYTAVSVQDFFLISDKIMFKINTVVENADIETFVITGGKKADVAL